MKKPLFRIMTVSIILLLCLFGAAAAEESNEETSGWEITDSSEITEDARAAFDSAKAELTDAVFSLTRGVCYESHHHKRANGSRKNSYRKAHC